MPHTVPVTWVGLVPKTVLSSVTSPHRLSVDTMFALDAVTPVGLVPILVESVLFKVETTLQSVSSVS